MTPSRFRTWAEYSMVGAVYVGILALIEWASGADLPLGFLSLGCVALSLVYLACARRWPGDGL